MPAGRPTEGLDHIDRLDGSPTSKCRLRAIIATLSGEQTIVDACRGLGIGSSRFHVMRHEVLQAAISRLEPQPPGRKPKRSTDWERVAQLERRAADLQAELVRERTRAEVAEVYPVRGRRKRGG